MFKRAKILLVLIPLFTLSLTGCETNPSQRDIGTILGAVAGGVVGSQLGSGSGNTLFTIAGVLAGAWAGSAIGRHMDDSDNVHTARTIEEGYYSQNGHAQNSWNRNQRRYESRVRVTSNPRYGNSCKRVRQEVVVIDERGRRSVAVINGYACRNSRTGELIFTPSR